MKCKHANKIDLVVEIINFRMKKRKRKVHEFDFYH